MEHPTKRQELSVQYARRFVDLAKPVKILDTRKTTPGLRALEKYAVKCGGGTNHRMGLHDGAMIKDNHIATVGDLEELRERIYELAERDVPIVIEAQTVERALSFPRTRALRPGMEIVKRAGNYFGWLLGFLGSVALFGMLPSVFIFLVLYVRFQGRESWRMTLPVSPV